MRETMNPALRILLAEPFPRAAAYRLYDTAGCHASSWRSCLLQITRCYERVVGRLLFSRCRVQRTRSYGYRPFPSAADMELPATSRLPSAANLELPAPARPRARRTRYRQLPSAANLELSTAERSKSGVIDCRARQIWSCRHRPALRAQQIWSYHRRVQQIRS